MDNIPKLRFPEFKGEWEEKRLGECLTLLYGKDWKDKSSTKKLYPVLGTGGVISYIDEFIYDKPCVLIGRKGSINNPVFIDKPFWTVDTQFYSEIHEGYSPKFLYYIFCTENWSKHDESTGVPSLSAKNVENTHKHIPSYSEQQKIADFLSNVDSIITAETKILNTLQKKKKALMQKLFTQQLRFKSDDGKDFPEWEEKKLGEVCNVLSGKRVPKGNKLTSVNTGLKYITVSDMGDKFVSNKDIKYITQEIETKIKKYKVITGDIIISVAGTLGKVNIITEEFNNANLTENCDKLTEFKGCITEYLFYFLQSDKFLDEINRIKTSSAQPKLALDRLRIFVIPIPIIKEQQKIADCLSSMDSLIQTQQKVVTTWQQRKKALLQQMFI